MKPSALIGLVGKKLSGKDSVYQVLAQASSEGKLKSVPIRFAFADALKVELAAKLGTTVELINENKILLREALQNFGLEMRTKDKEYWLKKIFDVYPNKEFIYPTFVIVTDVRFLNEASMIKTLGGKLVRVRRKLSDSSIDPHVSETEMDSIGCDNFIYNDEGKERLKFMAIDVLRQLYGGLLA